MKILRHAQDVRTLVFLSLALAFLFSISLVKPAGALLYVFLFLLNTFFVFLISLINHNHRHHPTFTFSFLNKLMDIFISICMGAPSTRLHLVHHFNHHRFYDSEKDWTNYRRHAKGHGLKRILSYIVSGAKNISRHRRDIKAPQSLKTQQWVERAAIWAFSIFSVWLNPGGFFLIILPSWIIGLLLLFTSNLLNHDQCELESKKAHSRNFLNPVENWFFLNNGFHGAHHAKPNLHWTKLPQLHQDQFQNEIPIDLKQNSFFGYAFRYIFQAQNKESSL